VEIPSNLDDVLRHILAKSRSESGSSVLAPEDEAYLNDLILAVRDGKRAIVVVEDADERLRYMFSNATRAEAVSMLGKVIESTGRRLSEGDD